MKINNKGMTLAEIMVVISIIAFLAVIVAVYLRSQVFKSYDARRKTEIKRISIAAEEYEKDHDCYPLSSQVVCINGGIGLMPYLDKIPCDPISGGSYYYEQENSSCPKWYRLYSNLQNETDGDYTAGLGPNGAYSYVYSSPNAPADIITVVEPETTPAGGGTAPPSTPQSTFYGCRSGACVPIIWDSSRPGPECDPNFQNSTCYGQCVIPANECQSWN